MEEERKEAEGTSSKVYKEHKGLKFFMPLLAGIYGITISFTAGMIIAFDHSFEHELIANAVELVAVVLTFVLAVKLLPKSFPEMRNYSFGKPEWSVLVAIALCIPQFIAVKYRFIYYVAGIWTTFDPQVVTYELEDLKEDLKATASALLLAPIYEELCFRVIPISIYKKKITRIVVVVIMAFLFALLHGRNWISVTIDAFVYSALFLTFKNVWVNICAHICNNLFATFLAVLAYWGVQIQMTEGSPLVLLIPWKMMVVCAVLAGAGIAGAVFVNRKRAKAGKSIKTMSEPALREFIKANARLVELAEYNYFFENGPKEDIVNALLEFQNPDGGFGHALEADNWNPNSNPIATNDAILRLNRADALDRDSQIVRDTVRYLKSGDGFNPIPKKWYFALESNRDYPHAFWWVPDEGSYEITDFNPTVSLATFLVCYSEDDGYYAGIVKDAFDFLLKAEKMSTDDLKCYQHAYYMLVKTGRNDLVDLVAAKEAITRLIDGAICRDISKYGREYAATPSDFFVGEAWNVFYNSSFDELIDGELNNLVNIQLEDGGFDIYWQWYTNYPEFEEARNMWRPRVSLERLLFRTGAGTRSANRV